MKVRRDRGSRWQHALHAVLSSALCLACTGLRRLWAALPAPAQQAGPPPPVLLLTLGMT